MRRVRCSLPGFLLLLLTVTTAERIFQPGTTYRIAQRPVYRTVSQPAYTCCPGWRRASRRPGLGCNIAVCQPPCQHGGKCASPNKCSCPLGWTGRCCQTDVDECAGGRRHGCSHFCLNLAGSYRCACPPGSQLHADGKTCQAPDPATEAPLPTSPAGVAHPAASEEVKELRSRVVALEEKLQLALAPFLQLEAPGLEGIPTDPISLLAHSLQQLDRIDSLSEQISFLEERLETCSCKNEL
ncbi:epidermal growth factor-like protein 7 isoform X2 [Hemicordylus capensis]|uniref:epidermal growth factor-like protein 7 isoform X2 n=1 Tax=Hemicordylus capensis TaxID=884348 RepID=UPI002303C85B|nr:epidermal growth factor-like protein 7 isoform X2 [Hemicordylus capensis]